MAPWEMRYDHVQGARQEGPWLTLLPTPCSHHHIYQSLTRGYLIQKRFSFEALLLMTGTTVCNDKCRVAKLMPGASRHETCYRLLVFVPGKERQ